jgi:hypothetical protein
MLSIRLWYARLILFCGALPLVAVSFPANAQISYPGSAGAGILFFERDGPPNGDTEIWSMNTDGTDVRQLTFDPRRLGNIYIGGTDSAESKVLYVALRFSGLPGDGKLFAVPANGGASVLLATDSTIQRYSTLSPDGNSALFFGRIPAQLRTVNTNDGSDLKTLVKGAGRGRYSPDGTKIAYPCDGLCTIDSDGSNQKRLTEMRAGYPAWNADGTAIVFSHFVSDISESTAVLFTIGSDGSNLKEITKATPGKFAEQDIRPTFSPDGSFVVFTRRDPSRRRVFRVNADGSELKYLASGEVPYLLPAFDATGANVFYEGAGEISRVGSDGGTPVLLGTGSFDPK